MQLDLTDEQAAALLALPNRKIENDRYPLSPRIQTLRAILMKLRPAVIGVADEIRAGSPADDARQCRGGSRAVHGVVQSMRLPQRTRPRRAGARWYGPETPVPEWRARLVCSQCGCRDVDMVVTGAPR